MYERAAVQCPVVVGLEVEHAGKILKCTVVGIDFGEQQSAVEKSGCVGRLELECVIIVGHGSEVVVKRIAQVGAVDV